MTDGESHYRKYTDDNLVDEAGSISRTEMMRRLKETIQRSRGNHRTSSASESGG